MYLHLASAGSDTGLTRNTRAALPLLLLTELGDFTGVPGPRPDPAKA